MIAIGGSAESLSSNEIDAEEEKTLLEKAKWLMDAHQNEVQEFLKNHKLHSVSKRYIDGDIKKQYDVKISRDNLATPPEIIITVEFSANTLGIGHLASYQSTFRLHESSLGYTMGPVTKKI